MAANIDLCRHESDVPIVLAAIKSKAQCSVTNDRDLTVLDSTTVKLHRQVQVMLPPVFLREMMGWTSEELEKEYTTKDMERYRATGITLRRICALMSLSALPSSGFHQSVPRSPILHACLCLHRSLVRVHPQG